MPPPTWQGRRLVNFCKSTRLFPVPMAASNRSAEPGKLAEPHNPFLEVVNSGPFSRLAPTGRSAAHQIDGWNQHGHLTGMPAFKSEVLRSAIWVVP
jgi:hypothetical protein